MSKICKFSDSSKNCTNQDCIECGKACPINGFGGDCDLFVPEEEVVQAEVMTPEAVRQALVPKPEVPPMAGWQAPVEPEVMDRAHDAGPKFTVVVSHRTVELPAAQALSVQFARVGKTAGAAVREMVVFGAMLEKIDDALTKDRYNPDGFGCSVKSWLERNCPEINYNTAKSYQRAAEGGRVLAKMAADVPLLPLMGRETPADAALAKVREDVLGVIANSSLNVLRRAALPVPVGNKLKGTHGLAQGRRALTAEEKAAEAEKTMRELVGSIGAYLRGPWFGMLTLESQDDFLGNLRHYVDAIEDKMRKAVMAR